MYYKFTSIILKLVIIFDLFNWPNDKVYDTIKLTSVNQNSLLIQSSNSEGYCFQL